MSLADDWLGQQRKAAQAVRRSLVEQWTGRKPEPRPGMTEEQLAGLRKQITALKERGSKGEAVGERLLELRRTHWKHTGADGG